MKLTSNQKVLLGFSLFALAFVIFTILNYFYFKMDYVLIGVFHEMLMIPILLAIPVLFIISIVQLFKLKPVRTPSVFLLLINSISLISVLVMSIGQST